MSIRDTLLFAIAAAVVGFIFGAFLQNAFGGAILLTLIASTVCIVAAIGGKQEPPADETQDENK